MILVSREIVKLSKLPSSSLHWSAISLRTGERTGRTENKNSSGHLTCSPVSSLPLRLKISLVFLSIVSICNSGKLFTNLFVKRVVLTISCIPCIWNFNIHWIELPGCKRWAWVLCLYIQDMIDYAIENSCLFPFNIHYWFICFKQFRTMSL